MPTYATLPVASIFIPPDRQRRDFNESKLTELAQSIGARGLINPITITADNMLVAGERRLRAHGLLGYEFIECRYLEDLDDLEFKLIEFEENIKRADLTWQEQTTAIESFHLLKSSMDAEWTQTSTAKELGFSPTHVTKHLLVAPELKKETAGVSDAQQFSTAYNFALRRQDRAKTAAKKDLTASIASVIAPLTPNAPPEPVEEARTSSIIQGNFIEWSKIPQKRAFNLIHCDFPYGINATKSGQSSAKNLGGYEDEESTYFDLLNAFGDNLDNFCAPSAHLVFWFSMNFYEETVSALESFGFRVFLPLLIWVRSDNKGILADANRAPRNITETALLCSRGDRKIVSAVSNAIVSKTTKEYHMSEKPHAVLTHFLRMLTDDSTRLLDPTAGSGMAVRVAEELGAAHALGIELNPDYVGEAERNLEL